MLRISLEKCFKTCPLFVAFLPRVANPIAKLLQVTSLQEVFRPVAGGCEDLDCVKVGLVERLLASQSLINHVHHQDANVPVLVHHKQVPVRLEQVANG